MLAQLVNVFLRNADQMVAAIGEAIEARDPKALHHAAHTFKGAVGNLAAKKAHQASLRLEQMGRSNTFAGAEEAFADLRNILSVLKLHLQEFEPTTV
jgi:HPt (histidine-containing phosphotransfer) domain-containing protein